MALDTSFVHSTFPLQQSRRVMASLILILLTLALAIGASPLHPSLASPDKDTHHEGQDMKGEENPFLPFMEHLMRDGEENNQVDPTEVIISIQPSHGTC